MVCTCQVLSPSGVFKVLVYAQSVSFSTSLESKTIPPCAHTEESIGDALPPCAIASTACPSNAHSSTSIAWLPQICKSPWPLLPALLAGSLPSITSEYTSVSVS